MIRGKKGKERERAREKEEKLFSFVFIFSEQIRNGWRITVTKQEGSPDCAQVPHRQNYRQKSVNNQGT